MTRRQALTRTPDPRPRRCVSARRRTPPEAAAGAATNASRAIAPGQRDSRLINKAMGWGCGIPREREETGLRENQSS
ncbi:hypothetical protein SKAU_G00308160 [Synaphobranchus kaupii]|uniref:Uncharacterized protein n=1 Tax=Synaphobranchus kaupii TaxID=118154 RepID=A0A9Q1ER65_SYNKA|nr:hypothetical protein SKAU_G00308160 [Synaphobranchus kaupii]